MRTVTYGAACSLDGFIADSDGAVDWIHFSADVEQYMSEYWSTVDAVLMGRRTWEFAAAQGVGGEPGSEAGPAPEAGSLEGSGIPAVATYLFSRTLSQAPPGTELVSSDAVDFVKTLKRQPGKGICLMGGGELAGSLFEAGVIDQVSLNVHPVLLGSGVPFFRDLKGRIGLELTESRGLDGGCVLMVYRVRN
ncbi:dihydrofolate reductase family protein [Arthrobacter sp. HMWF013]|uniref:dihydrofolate reductase family protein n=1 Tax=Arthrobacter sp. HMWF013 TaxID=2056849 RepID=UPI0015E7EE78|nr:dihydrofolate reductase family protein [Arthrobacter sp. HMWF013]